MTGDPAVAACTVMTPDDFRTQGKARIDWVADYLETIEQRRVTSTVQPGEVRAQLPEHPPAAPEPFADVLADCL